MTGEPVCLDTPRLELGEGPLWDAARKVLWCVDIKGRSVHCFDPATRAMQSWATPAAPGFIVAARSGGLVVGMKGGIHAFDPQRGRFSLMVAVEADRPGNRLNDGATDPCGRLWFGSMDDQQVSPSGSLYRLTRDHVLREMDAGYLITNGPAFSPDGRLMYHTDLTARTIFAFDVDAAGNIRNKRAFIRIEEGAGYPDGPTVDAEGCLWTGLFGGWALRRYSPAGELLSVISFPCANVTKIAFGGSDLQTVFATTAWTGLAAAERRRQPCAGSLFSFRSATPGRLASAFDDGPQG
jgi:D-xylonolactonase